MEFLDKLYESEYFGIGLFAVIAFLVMVFLVVLFFGKKDEKRRKLEETNKITVGNIENNTFEETSKEMPLEVPVENEKKEIPDFMTNMEIAPVSPINYEEEKEEPIKIDEEAPVSLANINEDINESSINPVVNNEVKPIIIETPKVEPITIEQPKVETAPIAPEPKMFEVQDYDADRYKTDNEITNFDLNEPTIVLDDIKPIIEEKPEPIRVTPTIIEEPVIGDTYYKPVEAPALEEVKVPNIDFDALADSISSELDELEKASSVEVTPISEIEEPKIEEEKTSELDALYVKAAESHKGMPLPKKIDLPIKKDE